jgi:hypothetical protein
MELRRCRKGAQAIEAMELEPKRRPEDQAGLRIRHNFFASLMRKSESALYRRSRRKVSAPGEALGDKAKGEGRGEKFL